jgi:LacI family transcriptional regulator
MVDIARGAGVSQTTVSFVLNNIDGARIAEETRRRVIDTARRLGYEPGPSLPDLDGTADAVVGVLINEISANYPIDLVDGLQLVARSRGQQLAIFVTDGETDREAESLATLKRFGVGRVIYANTFHAPVYPTEALQGFRHVFVNCFRPDRKGLAVVAAERAAGFVAARHLVGRGCRRIATITGDVWHTSAINLLAGFRRGLRAAGQDLDPIYLQRGLWIHDGARECMRTMLALPERPDGIFCHNDQMARGAMVAIAEAGLRVPDDIAVMGLDDREFARNLDLTTLVRPFSAQAQKAMEILLGPDTLEDGVVRVRCPLVVRGSTRRQSAARPDEVEPGVVLEEPGLGR